MALGVSPRSLGHSAQRTGDRGNEVIPAMNPARTILALTAAFAAAAVLGTSPAHAAAPACAAGAITAMANVIDTGPSLAANALIAALVAGADTRAAEDGITADGLAHVVLSGRHAGTAPSRQPPGILLEFVAN